MRSLPRMFRYRQRAASDRPRQLHTNSHSNSTLAAKKAMVSSTSLNMSPSTSHLRGRRAAAPRNPLPRSATTGQSTTPWRPLRHSSGSDSYRWLQLVDEAAPRTYGSLLPPTRLGDGERRSLTPSGAPGLVRAAHGRRRPVNSNGEEDDDV